MRRLASVLAVTAVAGALLLRTEGGAVVTDRLPPSSIEIKRHDPPATSTPWQLPKPGDPLYDATQEAEIKNNKHSHLVHVFERGVFKGYGILGHHGDDWTLSSGLTPQRPAKEMHDAFTPNPNLPADAVELSSSAQPDKSDYFPTRPKARSPNVPPDCIAVRVFHRGKLIGWTFMPKSAVAQLHKPK
jgi:hypothetical protein